MDGIRWSLVNILHKKRFLNTTARRMMKIDVFLTVKSKVKNQNAKWQIKIQKQCFAPQNGMRHPEPEKSVVWYVHPMASLFLFLLLSFDVKLNISRHYHDFIRTNLRCSTMESSLLKNMKNACRIVRRGYHNINHFYVIGEIVCLVCR